MFKHIYVYICVCIYVYVYIYICVYTYIYLTCDMAKIALVLFLCCETTVISVPRRTLVVANVVFS